MSGYFVTLLVASICGALCAVVSGGGFEKYIKYIASLVCVCLLLYPLREISVSPDISPYMPSSVDNAGEEGLYSLSSSLAEGNAEEYICEIVFGKFGIKPLYADINIDWTLSEPEVTGISVCIERNSAEASEVEDWLENALGGEVTVIYG